MSKSMLNFKRQYQGFYTQVNFRGDEGDAFEVYVMQGNVFFAGTRTDWEVLNLFNCQMAWSTYELHKLARAITKGLNQL